jgi:hypothetical protein
VTDEPDDTIDSAPTADASPASGASPIDPRHFQRNLAERLFPGPSPLMSEQVAKRIEGLISESGNDAALRAWRERRDRKASSGAASRRAAAERGASSPPGIEAPAVPASDEFAEVSEKLEQQNELLRAILASSVDTQTDARSTAQNSRTFAWAGTAIALLTLIATVISIVAAIRAN